MFAKKPLLNKNLPSIGHLYPILRGFHRKSRDLNGHHRKKRQRTAKNDAGGDDDDDDISGTETTELSFTTKNPMLEHHDTLSKSVTTSENDHGFNRIQVAVREKRSQNCPPSPDGEVSVTVFGEELYSSAGANSEGMPASPRFQPLFPSLWLLTPSSLSRESLNPLWFIDLHFDN